MLLQDEYLISGITLSLILMSAILQQPYTLSSAQLAAFERDGYLVLHNLLDEEATLQLQSWFRKCTIGLLL